MNNNLLILLVEESLKQLVAPDMLKKLEKAYNRSKEKQLNWDSLINMDISAKHLPNMVVHGLHFYRPADVIKDLPTENLTDPMLHMRSAALSGTEQIIEQYDDQINATLDEIEQRIEEVVDLDDPAFEELESIFEQIIEKSTIFSKKTSLARDLYLGVDVERPYFLLSNLARIIENLRSLESIIFEDNDASEDLMALFQSKINTWKAACTMKFRLSKSATVREYEQILGKKHDPSNIQQLKEGWAQILQKIRNGDGNLVKDIEQALIADAKNVSDVKISTVLKLLAQDGIKLSKKNAEFAAGALAHFYSKFESVIKSAYTSVQGLKRLNFTQKGAIMIEVTNDADALAKIGTLPATCYYKNTCQSLDSGGENQRLASNLFDDVSAVYVTYHTEESPKEGDLILRGLLRYGEKTHNIYFHNIYTLLGDKTVAAITEKLQEQTSGATIKKAPIPKVDIDFINTKLKAIGFKYDQMPYFD